MCRLSLWTQTRQAAGAGCFYSPSHISPLTSCGVWTPISPTVITVIGKSCLLQIADSL